MATKKTTKKTTKRTTTSAAKRDQRSDKDPGADLKPESEAEDVQPVRGSGDKVVDGQVQPAQRYETRTAEDFGRGDHDRLPEAPVVRDEQRAQRVEAERERMRDDQRKPGVIDRDTGGTVEGQAHTAGGFRPHSEPEKDTERARKKTE